jgi:hypothetical protein
LICAIFFCNVSIDTLKSAAKNTFHTAISEGQEKCRASGANIGGLINLGEEVYYSKAEIPIYVASK